MRKSLLALSAVAALSFGIAAPSPAQANAWWIVPVVIGGVIVAGAAAAATSPYRYDPAYGRTYYRGNITVEPNCRIVRERVPGGWRRVEICN